MVFFSCISSFAACSPLEFPAAAVELAKEKEFELKGYGFDAAAESSRSPRIVTIAGVQNKIVLSTSAPVSEQVKFSLV